MLSPLLQKHAPSIKFIKHVPSRISRLRLGGCPIAVFLAVSNAIVASLNAHSLRSLAHVFQERLKAMAPRFAHANSSPAITRERGILFAVTPVAHCFPNAIGGALGHPVGYFWHAAILPLFIIAMSGCATPPTPPSGAERAPIPPSLTSPCPDLSPLSDGTGASVLRKLIEVAEQYYDCQRKHRELVNAVK